MVPSISELFELCNGKRQRTCPLCNEHKINSVKFRQNTAESRKIVEDIKMTKNSLQSDTTVALYNEEFKFDWWKRYRDTKTFVLENSCYTRIRITYLLYPYV